jgi:hypothetical protein
MKGRRIESTHNAELGSNCSTSQLRTLILSYNRREIRLVSFRPFRANRVFLVFPGLNPGLSPVAPSGQALRAAG